MFKKPVLCDVSKDKCLTKKLFVETVGTSKQCQTACSPRIPSQNESSSLLLRHTSIDCVPKGRRKGGIRKGRVHRRFASLRRYRSVPESRYNDIFLTRHWLMSLSIFPPPFSPTSSTGLLLIARTRPYRNLHDGFQSTFKSRNHAKDGLKRESGER